jgi:hypothetical protein
MVPCRTHDDGASIVNLFSSKVSGLHFQNAKPQLPTIHTSSMNYHFIFILNNNAFSHNSRTVNQILATSHILSDRTNIISYTTQCCHEDTTSWCLTVPQAIVEANALANDQQSHHYELCVQITRGMALHRPTRAE